MLETETAETDDKNTPFYLYACITVYEDFGDHYFY